jgi:hypothetical protein
MTGAFLFLNEICSCEQNCSDSEPRTKLRSESVNKAGFPLKRNSPSFPSMGRGHFYLLICSFRFGPTCSLCLSDLCSTLYGKHTIVRSTRLRTTRYTAIIRIGQHIPCLLQARYSFVNLLNNSCRIHKTSGLLSPLIRHTAHPLYGVSVANMDSQTKRAPHQTQC